MIIDDSSDFLEWTYFILDYLKSKGISYWIDYGTLLGAVRDGDVISWDKDFDVGVYYDDLHKIGKIVQHDHDSGIPEIAEFQVWDNDRYRWGLCRIAPKPEIFVEEDPKKRKTSLEFIDLYLTKNGEQFDYKYDDWIGSTTTSDLVYPEWPTRDIKKYYVYETAVYSLGGFEFDGPKYPKKLLDWRYGSREGWELPDDKYYEKYELGSLGLAKPSAEAMEIKERWLSLREGKIRCSVAGCFDMFHIGHLNLLNKVAEIYDYVTVAVHSDESVSSYKRKPVISCSDRAEIISKIEYVDRVIAGTSKESVATVDFLKKNNINYSVGGEVPEGEVDGWNKELRKAGMKHYYKRTDGISTTDIINNIITI